MCRLSVDNPFDQQTRATFLPFCIFSSPLCLLLIRVSKACIFFSTCQIAQFKATICRRCPCQPSTTDTSISPILLRRLLANVSANSLRSNSAPTFALTHKIGQKSPIVCLCLSGTDTICKLLSYCCAI